MRWEQSLQQSLLLPSEKTSIFIKFNLDGLLRGDYQSRMNGYAVGRQNGWMSANDIRELEDMNRVITSYSIHYTKLYESSAERLPVASNCQRCCGWRWKHNVPK